MAYFNYCQGLTMTSEKFHDLFGGPPRDPESVITQKDMDLAASVQLVCEEVVLKAARHVHELTGSKHLVMAGGVALNCVANGRIVREGPFDDIWVQPAAGDAGGALGAALFVWHQVLGQDRVVVHDTDSQSGSLLGPRFDDGDTELLLDALYARYEYLPDEDELLERVAQILADEKVVGWFQGRMEYGPRALGSRSIIGDPRSARMQQTMNLKIKFRESFRPFAPSVLKEHADELFDMGAEDSPYMLLVGPVRDEWRTQLSEEDREKLKDPDLRVRVSVPRSTVPAITHVDYSARVQTVDAERHGRYYRLIKKFYDLTECPALVNTSFNIRGEPIVCTPEDAYRCFMATDMDYLVIENFLLEKSVQPQGLIPGIEKYKELQPLD
jgi:carbamoyltransferase